jgi:hypothetical protein
LIDDGHGGSEDTSRYYDYVDWNPVGSSPQFNAPYAPTWMRHFVVTARLKPGSASKVLELLREGPPFDLEESGLERHMIFLADDQLVFMFEGNRAEEEAARLLDQAPVLDKAGQLGRCIEGSPTLPQEVFSWERPPSLEGVMFGPDPGPGDSDGGERD